MGERVELVLPNYRSDQTEYSYIVLLTLLLSYIQWCASNSVLYFNMILRYFKVYLFNVALILWMHWDHFTKSQRETLYFLLHHSSTGLSWLYRKRMNLPWKILLMHCCSFHNFHTFTFLHFLISCVICSGTFTERWSK